MDEIANKIQAIVLALNSAYLDVYFDRGLLSDLNKNIERNFPLFYLLPLTSTLSPINNGYSFTKSYNIRMYVLQNTGEDVGLDVNNTLQSDRLQDCETLAENFIKLFNTTYNEYIQRGISIEEARGLLDFTNYHLSGVLINMTIDIENFIDC